MRTERDFLYAARDQVYDAASDATDFCFITVRDDEDGHPTDFTELNKLIQHMKIKTYNAEMLLKKARWAPKE